MMNNAKDEGKNICAVGTTVMRTIETAVGTDGHLKEFDGWTNKFIFPPYDFSVANSMVTNFHLPLSTLLMLVAAYGGYDLGDGGLSHSIEGRLPFRYLWRRYVDFG